MSRRALMMMLTQVMMTNWTIISQSVQYLSKYLLRYSIIRCVLIFLIHMLRWQYRHNIREANKMNFIWSTFELSHSQQNIISTLLNYNFLRSMKMFWLRLNPSFHFNQSIFISGFMKVFWLCSLNIYFYSLFHRRIMHATAFIQSQETHELTLVYVCLPKNKIFVDNSQQRKSYVGWDK